MNFELIATLGHLQSGTLRERAQIHAADEVILLRARDDTRELGLVVLDLNTGDAGEVILVEVYVLTAFRSHGVGTEILRLTESWARDRGYVWITLDAEPLDDDDDEAKAFLIRWYQRRGYRVLGSYDHLGKRLTDATQSVKAAASAYLPE